MDQAPPPTPIPEPTRVLAGIGCRGGTDPAEIVALIRGCFTEASTPITALVALATHTRKADDAGLRHAAAQLGVPLLLLDDTQLAPSVPTPSAVVEHHTGYPSLAEACALAAGPLLLPKRQTRRVTCALAILPPGWLPDRFNAAQPTAAATHASTPATSCAGG